ncbi:MAG TPA: FtsX-like permease family protein [Treponemataceae bacterium]|nr:FtsX-like permease family protein [Treponemataceae bacterium]
MDSWLAMNFKSSFWYATKLLNPPTEKKSTGRRSLLGAIFCIALSLVPLVVVQTVADGMIEGITARMVGLSSFHAAAYLSDSIEHISIESHIDRMTDVRDSVQKESAVSGAFIEVSGTALAAGKNGRSGAQIRAVNNRLFTENDSFRQYLEIIEGEAAFSKSNSAVIGKKIAEELGVHVGDYIRLIGAKTTVNGKIIPKVKTFEVSGIVSSGYEEIDALWVFVPLESGIEFLTGSRFNSKIGLETDDAFSKDFYKTVSNINKLLKNNWVLFPWDQLNTSQYDNFSSTRILLLFIMFLILLVATVNISSAIVMVVMERRSEIAILKSIGASNAGITTAFVLCGTFCGMGGVLIGLPLGLLCSVNVNEIFTFIEKIVNVCANFLYLLIGGTQYVPVELLNPAYYLESIPIYIPFKELLMVAFGTIFLSMIVSLIPSVKAGREKPLSIFRKM